MNAVKRTAPGYILLDKYEMKSKVGAWHTIAGDGDDAPELGIVVEVGPLLPEKKMPFAADHLPSVGDIIGYKKYNHYKFGIGAKELYVLPFESYLFTLEPPKEKDNVEAKSN